MLSNCDLVSNVSPLLIFCRYQMKCKSVSNVSPRYILQTLLHLMAWNDDTNLVSRGGLEGLYYVQQQAQKLLWQGGVLVEGGIEAMQSLDDELILRNLSPGGSADLLAVTWFLSHFPAGSLYPE